MNTSNPFIERGKKTLMEKGIGELQRAAENHFILPVHLDLVSITSIVGAVQLALRHPAYTGPSSLICREFIAAVISRLRELGYLATAEMLTLGNDPAYDDPPNSSMQSRVHSGDDDSESQADQEGR